MTKLPIFYGVLPIWHICTCDGHFTQQLLLLRKEFFGTGVTRIEYRVKKKWFVKLLRMSLEHLGMTSRMSCGVTAFAMALGAK